ncbi:DNA (cytosine-5-)-methyltransferase [Halomicroarcula sp. F13]|uniref:DNA (cytosine-5-)-methyltransferase n=1 Tax=Haloarcula rubra TaxID=2487747 RepID=A0AAW4PT54_9EURY|nr:DNA (cytosine-5-)-methyltransferase [Halomicroarcula rubra]MBX0323859.1 DNA (cytosine-5-)-methyltransferase [Halomicroarcula rubra]
MTTVTAVDLFCGGGGLSTALAEACEDLDRDVELVAVNHWGKAIETHERNHPWATHLNAKIEELHPPDVVDPGTVDILIAAPECTHFSTARGGKPVTEQARASPMHVLDWVGKLQPQTLLLENVPEFESWGPIVDGEPSRDGTKFDAWKAQLEADRYSVRHTKLNAADYGDATSRRRFFVMGRRDYRPSFPEPTHSEDGEVPGTEPYRTAAEIIDWSDTGETLWTRSRPLSNNTMQRIAEGIRQHCDERLSAFAEAVATLTPDDVEAMQADVVAVDDVQQAAAERSDPFLVEGPAAIADRDETTALSVPMVMGQHSNAKAKDSRESPLPTIATRGAIHYIHADAFVLPRNGAFRGLHSNATYEADDRPLHTVTAKNHDGHLVSPFLVEYYGNSDVKTVEEPLPTVTTKDRHALCLPDLYPWGLDLRYRMLQPRELAAAQGFPPDYEFAGNKTETTKQIGNAVPVNLGKALVKQLLLPTDQPAISQWEESDQPVDGEADD